MPPLARCRDDGATRLANASRAQADETQPVRKALMIECPTADRPGADRAIRQSRFTATRFKRKAHVARRAIAPLGQTARSGRLRVLLLLRSFAIIVIRAAAEGEAADHPAYALAAAEWSHHTRRRTEDGEL